MNRHFQKLILIFALLGFWLSGAAQVTIGAGLEPAKGALLDLKDHNPVGSDKTTATKGLLLPRVNLTNLKPAGPDELPLSIGNTSGESWNLEDHIGLVVYNVNRCVNGIPVGSYVWTGVEWEFIGNPGTQSAFAPTLSQTYFDLPSGWDARGAITPQNLTVTWAGVTAPTWALQSSGGSLTQIAFTSPALTGTVGASPYSMIIEAQAMNTTTEVTAANPWHSKETRIAFTNLATECGQQGYVTLNQTNYALRVNNQTSNSQITYTSTSPGTFAVQGNAAWTTSKSDPNNVLASTSPATGTQGGEDRKDGTTVTLSPQFTYTTNAASKYHSADITFKDTASVKRFNDITVSILNCSNTNEPTLRQWAERLGFTTAEIDAVETSGVSSAIKNGYQLHRDQGTNGQGANGLLFISSEFGSTAGRWMITNLAARSYATGSRTGTDATVITPLPASPNAANDYVNPQWIYPHPSPSNGTISTIYDNNPRIGLLYNWAAATNKKAFTIDEGENALTPNVDPQAATIQGICPNGWHLPSDREWTYLEQEISSNTSRYSGLPDAGPTITVGGPPDIDILRGTTHGQAMKDPCPAPNQTTFVSNGSSNVMSPAVSGGFNAILAGEAYGGSANSYGRNGTWWSASSYSSTRAWSRRVFSSNSQVARNAIIDNYPSNGVAVLISVRCKKD
jgi:hypothetical protein